MDSVIDVNTLFGPLPLASVDLTVETLLELMAAGGVTSACTLSTLGLLLDATVGNAATRAACSEYPQLMPLATLNPASFFGDAAPLLRLRQEGFRAVRFFPSVQHWPIAFQPFSSILEILAPTGIPIMVSISSPGDITALQAVAGSYPRVILTAVDLTHLPEALAAMRKHSNWMIETSRLLAIGSVKLVADAVGADRILFGTGAPAQSLSAALHALQHSGVSDPDRRLILCGNAERVL
jgi:predicted TIM-barrel fold metal-dependent hydrolase